jgi:Sulfatase
MADLPAAGEGVTSGNMLNRRLRQALSPGAVYYWLAFAFFVVVFGVIPLSIYAHSGDDWEFPYYQTLYIPLFGLILCLAMFLVIRLIALVHAGTAAAVACALFCLGVFLLLAHVYAPIQIGPLDGSEMESEEPLQYTLIEIAILAVALVAFFQLRRGRGLGIASLFSLALSLVGAGYVGALAFADRAALSAAGSPDASAPTRGSSRIQGNVYHIVLDAMQTDAFLLALERAARAGSFEGFELFENNVSNYITTVPSSASYLSGSFYKGGDFDDWAREGRSRGLLRALSDRGYRVWMYAPFAYWQSRVVDHFRHNVGIYEETIGLAPAGLYDLLHIWLASLAPNPLTDEALSDAEGLRDWLFELITEKPRPLSIQQGLHPYSGVMMLRRLLRDEERRAPEGQYVYAHAALPHAPWVFDRNCHYVGNEAGRRDRAQRRQAYLAQAECAVTLVTDFLEALKRLGRYDLSTVVVHADHGQRIRFADAPRASRTLDMPDSILLSSVNALLMIKRPHARGPLQIKTTPTQLIDLFPTILDILGLEAAHDLSGRSVYSIRDDEQRDARFGFDPTKKHGHDLVEIRIEDQRDLPNSQLTVLGPAADPATWRGQADGAVTLGRPEVTSQDRAR